MRKIVRPPTLKQIRTLRALAFGLLLPLVGLPLIWSYCMLSVSEDVGGSLVFLIPGVTLAIAPFYFVHVLNRRRDVFMRSMRSTNALVVERKQEKSKRSGSTGDLVGEIVVGILWTIEKRKHPYAYSLVFEFDTQQAGKTSSRTRLEVEVSEDKFNAHSEGSTLRIRYAQENPQIAVLEDEYQSLLIES